MLSTVREQKGRTVIENAAKKEPEIIDVATLLTSMGHVLKVLVQM